MGGSQIAVHMLDKLKLSVRCCYDPMLPFAALSLPVDILSYMSKVDIEQIYMQAKKTNWGLWRSHAKQEWSHLVGLEALACLVAAPGSRNARSGGVAAELARLPPGGVATPGRCYPGGCPPRITQHVPRHEAPAMEAGGMP